MTLKQEIWQHALIDSASNPDDFVRGAQWMYEQLMKDSFECEVKVDAGGYPDIPQIELYDYDKDIPLAKEGDKYKVILIREN